MSILLSNVNAGYEKFRLNNINLEIATGSLTALIGPNGCGKSTLLKAIARILPLKAGSITIGDNDISRVGTKTVARTVAVLPQHPIVPPGIKVEQLIGYGRAPHQNLLGFKTTQDHEMIEYAIETVSLVDLRERLVEDLSGGQRQRAFIAMCIAQDTPYILLDEPTSFLDIKYQFEVLDLMTTLNKSGKTVVTVLHDIAQATRYADNLVVMKEGIIHANGKPEDVITSQLMNDVYDIKVEVYADPVSGTSVVSPTEYTN